MLLCILGFSGTIISLVKGPGEDKGYTEVTQHGTVTGEGQAGCYEKAPHQKVVGMEQSLHGSRHSPELLELKKHLNNALRHRVWFLEGAVWRHWTQYPCRSLPTQGIL